MVTAENLELKISGLKEGKHTLLTFHNAFDVITGKTFSPIKIYVNGKLQETVNASQRTTAKIDAAMAYLTFNAVKIRRLRFVSKSTQLQIPML